MATQLDMLTPIASPMATRPPSPSSAAAHGRAPTPAAFASPPCCAGCGAAKAAAGCCAGCGGHQCVACMPAGQGSPCNNCSTLCSACKPIACSFCDTLSSRPPVRLCEACAGTCDACRLPACGACACQFTACAACGYAACEACSLQLQLGRESAAGGAGSAASAGGAALGGCWCAPPLRSASNVRAVSSQRYQMASQLHPSMLASSMEAAGLRDADIDTYDRYDDDEEERYEQYEEPDEEDDQPPRGGPSSNPGTFAAGGFGAGSLESVLGSLAWLPGSGGSSAAALAGSGVGLGALLAPATSYGSSGSGASSYTLAGSVGSSRPGMHHWGPYAPAGVAASPTGRQQGGVARGARLARAAAA